MNRRLYRSRKENMIAGVAGGLAEYFSLDPAIMRLIFVIMAFISGIGIVAYIVLWIIVPYEDTDARYSEKTETAKTYTVDTEGNAVESDANAENVIKPEDTKEIKASKKTDNRMMGVVLIAIGLVFLADNFIPFFSFWDYWPLLLIGIGSWLLIKSSKN